jgi:hypothetical protein
MSTRTAGLVMMAVGTLLTGGRSATAQDATGADHHRHDYHISLTGAAGTTVGAALRGAMRRLARPECQRLFNDFTDRAGRELTVSLAASADSPADLLAALYFVDGDDTIRCRAGGMTGAFTRPGSRVIHVCGHRFVQFAGNTKGGEMLLIHELLHALGLGENPPTSQRITHAVLSRCG